LEHKARVDNHLVFGTHRSADSADQLFVALVVFVLAVRDDARRRSDGKKCFGDFNVLERRFEIVNVSLQFRLAGIGDRTDAHRFNCCCHALTRIELGVELGELFAVDAPRERVGPGRDRSAFKTAQSFQHVLRPGNRLSEFAIADDVNTDLSLLVHHLGNRTGQTFAICGNVVRLARLLGTQKVLQRLRADQAAYMRGKNSIGTVLHRSLVAVQRKLIQNLTTHAMVGRIQSDMGDSPSREDG
jgi:hypothetical protein